MPRGRPQTPTKIKELSGNPGKRKINRSEPQPVGQPCPNAKMSKVARAIFDRVVACMPASVYTGADETLIVAYAEASALHRKASEALLTEPPVTVGSTGQMVVSPWVKLQADQARLIATIGAKLGLDPVSRQALNSDNDGQAADEFDGLIN